MSKTISIIYDGEVFRPETPLDLAPDTRFEITVPESALAPSSTGSIDEYENLRSLYLLEGDQKVVEYLEQHPSLVKFLEEAPSEIWRYFPQVELALKTTPLNPTSNEPNLAIVLYVQGEVGPLTQAFNALKANWWFKVDDRVADELTLEIEHPEFSTSRARTNLENYIGAVEAPEDWGNIAMKFHNPENVSAPVGGYSHGLEIAPGSRLLFISGTIPEEADGVIPDNFNDQCEVVWHNIEKILQAAGMSIANLVKVTTFLTDRSQVVANGEIRRRHLGETRPSLTVVIAQTLEMDWLLEIEAIAAAEPKPV